ncbi:hypothetical protein L9F63_002526 [Diploptera punctata]|uniref:Uncharacterized protein n=1 Tax=Diploptera punctata TaxID=6984 RepID=A0AAD7ZSL4_DIPPU|nr:hypothetical protein L9F63_002526 [Diploptera punctata]
MYVGTCCPWWYCQQIVDPDVQVQCILQNLPLWPGYGCQQALNTVLENHKKKLSEQIKSKLKLMLHKISIYEKILPFMNCAELKTWYDVKCTSEKNPSLVVRLLLEAREFQACLTWLELHNVSERALHLFDTKFFLLFPGI